MSRLGLVLASLAACQDKFYVTGSTTPPAPTDAPPETDEVPTDVAETDTEPVGHTGLAGHSAAGHTAVPASTADTATGGIPDPRTGMVPDFCEQQPYYNPNAPTATRYYVGDFTVDLADQVRGVEVMQLFFNAAGTAVLGGQSECVVVWTTTGQAQAPGSCRSCTTGLGLRMAVDRARTDCPAGFWVGDAQFSVDYDVDAAPTMESTFTFSASGNYLGRWYWEDTRYTYLSDPGCVLF